MIMTINQLLEKAVEITKEYASSGGVVPLDAVLEQVFSKLKQLNQESQ